MPKRNPDTGATIWDVAKESNVSIATVSHVINNGPRTVRPDTRERVLSAIKKLNYHPNAMARGLVRRRMNTIGIISAVFGAQDIVANPYASGILHGVLQGASAVGYDILLFTEPWKNLRESGHVYRDRRADGVIAISPSLESDMVSGLVELDLAVTSISGDSLSLGVPSVDVDNVLGVKLVVDYLVGLGHTRIAHLVGSEDLISARQRRDAFVECMRGHGLSIPDDFIVPCGYEGGKIASDRTTELLLRPDRPTAIFGANDPAAIGALHAAQALGMRVPEDVSLVGFDDLAFIEHMVPALTTVRQPLAEIGQLATELLIQRVNGAQTEAQVHLIAPTLSIRATTGPAPSGRG
ncbi:MAG: LacI family DNA-binding transcriptional regulator [Capsulimonadaceae bacterium]